MPPVERIPIEQQSAWRLRAGIIVASLFALIFLVVPIYVAANAQGGNAATWALVVAVFWTGAAACLLAARICLKELRARRLEEDDRR